MHWKTIFSFTRILIRVFLACQAFILQVWGEKDSRSLVALYHFLIAVGGIITPLIGK